MGDKLRVAIVGTGNIGTDLLIKATRSAHLECTLFAGRNLSSPGMQKALALGVRISSDGIRAVEENQSACDLIFDCTSAVAHAEHAAILARLGKVVVNLTPARTGAMCVPAINLGDCIAEREINMITCGGQVAVPLAHVIGAVHPGAVEYIEVVSSIASRSAGPATRLSIDEYIDATQRGVARFSGVEKTKSVLILNPAIPSIDMQTTVFARVAAPRLDALAPAIDEMVGRLKAYVPGYELMVPPLCENGRIVVSARVTGLGDYLPPYAGNLDIINCAALAAAEGYALARTAPIRAPNKMSVRRPDAGEHEGRAERGAIPSFRRDSTGGKTCVE